MLGEPRGDQGPIGSGGDPDAGSAADAGAVSGLERNRCHHQPDRVVPPDQLLRYRLENLNWCPRCRRLIASGVIS